MARPTLLTALGLLVAAGCSDTADAPLVTVTDSAGIEIVLSGTYVPEWSISDEPILSMGVVAGGGPTEFYDVRDLELMPEGRLAVVNRGTEEVRVFDPDGALAGSFGGKGRGPREFVGLSMIRELADSLLTYDSGNDRLQVRDAEGSFVRSFRLEWFNGLLFPVDLSSQGAILAVTARHMTELNGSGRVVDTALVSTYDLDGRLLDSIGRLPHNERFVKRVGNRQTTVGAPFAASASLVSTAAGICYTFGPAPEVRCFDAGGAPTRIARLGEAPRPVTERHIARYWDDVWDEAEGSYRDAMLRVRDDITFPSHLPAFGQLLVDDRARVWGRRYLDPTVDATDESWVVLQDGRLMATLATPRGVRIFDVEDDRIAGVWTDELGVEHVRVYRLQASRP